MQHRPLFADTLKCRSIECLREPGKRYAFRLLRRESDCEEIVQEAYCRLLAQQNSRWHERLDEFAAVFFSTVRNLCIDLSRRLKHREWHVDQSKFNALPNSAIRSPDECIQHRELVDRLDQAIDSLPEKWRTALLLRTHGELNYRAISQYMNCSHDQVRTWIYRARKQLSDNLNSLLDRNS